MPQTHRTVHQISRWTLDMDLQGVHEMSQAASFAGADCSQLLGSSDVLKAAAHTLALAVR